VQGVTFERRADVGQRTGNDRDGFQAGVVGEGQDAGAFGQDAGPGGDGRLGEQNGGAWGGQARRGPKEDASVPGIPGRVGDDDPGPHVGQLIGCEVAAHYLFGTSLCKHGGGGQADRVIRCAARTGPDSELGAGGVVKYGADGEAASGSVTHFEIS